MIHVNKLLLDKIEAKIHISDQRESEVTCVN